EQTDTPFTSAAHAGQLLRIPIGHGEGNYFAPPDMLQTIEANRQVVLRYVNSAGRVDDAANPNGSVNAIAGLCDEARNVVGIMPHPERACEVLLGGVDGRVIFDSIVGTFRSADDLAFQPSLVGNERSAGLSPSLSPWRGLGQAGERSR